MMCVSAVGVLVVIFLVLVVLFHWTRRTRYSYMHVFLTCSANFLGLTVHGRFGPIFPRLCDELAGGCADLRLSETRD